MNIITTRKTAPTQIKERNRKRQITLFNPQFNLHTKMKIGKSFLNILDKYFFPHFKLQRFFNQTIVKYM